MIYKGYTIFADVNVNEQWDIEEYTNGDGETFVKLEGYRDNGGAEEAGICDFQIEDEEGDTPDWADDFYSELQDAKEAIDKNGDK